MLVGCLHLVLAFVAEAEWRRVHLVKVRPLVGDVGLLGLLACELILLFPWRDLALARRIARHVPARPVARRARGHHQQFLRRRQILRYHLLRRKGLTSHLVLVGRVATHVALLFDGVVEVILILGITCIVGHRISIAISLRE